MSSTFEMIGNRSGNVTFDKYMASTTAKISHLFARRSVTSVISEVCLFSGDVKHAVRVMCGTELNMCLNVSRFTPRFFA